MNAPAKRIRRWLRLPADDGASGNQPQDDRGAGYLARISVAGFGFTALATSFTIFVLPTRILDVAPEESKNTYLGVLAFVGMLIAVVTQPVAGGLSDRYRSRWGRRRPFIVIGTVASLPFLVAAGVAQTYVQLFIFIIVLQLFSNSALGPYQALIRDQIPQTRRGAASGMKMLVEVSGAGVVTVLVGVLISQYDGGGSIGWLWGSVVLLGVVLLAGAIMTSRSIKEPVSTRQEPTELAPSVTKAHPDFRWFLGSRFFIAIAVGSMATFARFFLEDSVGLENPTQGLIIMMGVVGVCIVLVTYPAGVLADRVGRKPLMMVGGVLAAAGMLWLIAATDLAGVAVSAVLAGLAIGLFIGPNWAMASDLVSVRRTAQQMGYLNLAVAGGAGLARLNGIWVDRLNSGDGDLGYSTLMVVSAILFLVGTLLLLRVRVDYRAKPQLAGGPGIGAVEGS